MKDVISKKTILSLLVMGLIASGCDNNSGKSSGSVSPSPGDVTNPVNPVNPDVTKPVVPEVIKPSIKPDVEKPGEPEVVKPEKPDVTEPVNPVIPEEIKPAKVTKVGYLTLGGSQQIVGKEVKCNDENPQGFSFVPGETVTCKVGRSVLATFDTIHASSYGHEEVEKTAFILNESNELKNSKNKRTNTELLLLTSNTCSSAAHKLCLEFSSVFELTRFETMYSRTGEEVDNFKKIVNESVANNSKATNSPSTHTSIVAPVLTSGASADFNANFVSASAESFYQYQPQELILSTGQLVDSMGRGIAGLDYYTQSGRGITDEEGKFDFNWGENISFGIDTFELGSVRGNKSTFKLYELGDETRGVNVERLVYRYSQSGSNGHRSILKSVRNEFAKYPNVINETINLSLSHGGVLEAGSATITLPNEFSEQFENGLTKQIDDAICSSGNSCNKENLTALNSYDMVHGSIQSDINKLWGINPEFQPVNKFHIFHDSTWFYGSTGDARGQSVLNISNTAFPVVMARNDHNYWLSLGEKRAWDGDKLAYVTEAPSIVVPENVNVDSITFDLPFITIGQAGSGKLMVMGNAHYNSILVCPNGYSWEGWLNRENVCDKNSDSNDMKHFLQNVLRYLSNEKYQINGNSALTIGTNIDTVYFKKGGQVAGWDAPFTIHPDFGSITVKKIDDFAHLDPAAVPVLILNGFEYVLDVSDSSYSVPLLADLNRPKLTQQDVTNLISYMNKGGSILIMESVAGTLQEPNARNFVRLLDAAGLSMGVDKNAVLTAPKAAPSNTRGIREKAIWVYERYSFVDGQPVYNIDENGIVNWKHKVESENGSAPKLEVASWSTEIDGEQVIKHALVDEGEHTTKESLEAAKQEIFDAFPGLKECKDTSYHYEINCLEYRPGNAIPHTGSLYYPIYTEINAGKEISNAMFKASDLGTNMTRLFNHELYFRTKGLEGERLSKVDMERLYQNMSVWLWNKEKYRFDSDKNDELGFKTFTEFLNCYSNDSYQGSTCPNELKNKLLSNGMIYSGSESGKLAGMMNPDYPLNYMEKPLTRLMLGRSYWDMNIKVDTAQYPGNTDDGDIEEVTEDITLYSNPTKWFTGNLQSTGLWAPARKDVTISSQATTPVTVTVSLADDLTGREKHEVALKRPPRMSQSFNLDAGKSITFTSPYGGLIYIQGISASKDAETFKFSGVVKAPLYKDGQWKNDKESPAPLGEVESQTFVYTAPKRNLEAANFDNQIQKFANELDVFGNAVNDFHGRNANDGAHKKFTSEKLVGHKHRFTNDVQISIGDAHSGYPVMNSSFNTESSNIPTTPLDDWLLWHEVGHNTAEAPLNVIDATEVANNVMALYMQDLFQGKMSRVETDITAAPDYLKQSEGQGWARGTPGERLVMFAQLKEWAEHNFDIAKWYGNEIVPSFYNQRPGMKGWHLFQLMHRKARGDSQGDNLYGGKNYCANSHGNVADQLMLCASYVTQTDLSSFFKLWNPGTKAYQLPGDTELRFEGGVSELAYATLAGMKLKKPEKGPETVGSVTVHSLDHAQ